MSSDERGKRNVDVGLTIHSTLRRFEKEKGGGKVLIAHFFLGGYGVFFFFFFFLYLSRGLIVSAIGG